MRIPKGTIRTYAGGGTTSLSGTDTGSPSDVDLGNITAVALDSAGNLFIADVRSLLVPTTV